MNNKKKIKRIDSARPYCGFHWCVGEIPNDATNSYGIVTEIKDKSLEFSDSFTSVYEIYVNDTLHMIIENMPVMVHYEQGEELRNEENRITNSEIAEF